MPGTEKTYPDWVQAFRTRGTTVKKKGDAYYLYKRTSKRVPGKKYPQPVDTYIGLITPDGVIESGRRKVSLTDIEVFEYGYSKAIWELCPDEWKNPLGDDWEDVLKIIILKWSQASYLGREQMHKGEQDLHCQLRAQMGSLSRRIYKKHDVDLRELEPLKTIYLLLMGKETVVSKINSEQKKLIERLGLNMEV